MVQVLHFNRFISDQPNDYKGDFSILLFGALRVNKVKLYIAPDGKVSVAYPYIYNRDDDKSIIVHPKNDHLHEAIKQALSAYYTANISHGQQNRPFRPRLHERGHNVMPLREINRQIRNRDDDFDDSEEVDGNRRVAD